MKDNVFLWFESESKLNEFCRVVANETPRFCESFAHCAELTIEQIEALSLAENKYKRVFLVTRKQTTKDSVSNAEMETIRRWGYEKIRANKNFRG